MHPKPQAIEFRKRPIAEGALVHLNEKRRGLLDDVVTRTIEEFSDRQMDLILGEALYLERARLKRIRKLSPSYPFTFPRHRRDRRLWGSIRSGLLQGPGEIDRNQLLHRVVSHYAEEIGGHFDPRVYRFATSAVPWFFGWLLNAASVNQFLPWKMTESLQSTIRIQGEIAHLQALARKGTILLVPTHQSNIDSVLIGYLIYLMGLPPFAYGAGLNLFSNPVLGFFMSRLGAYTVDRQKSSPLYKATLKNYSTRILREGMHSIFFPGGGRSRSGAIESHLKLGLLGTGLAAQIENYLTEKPHPNVYVVPMTTSYGFVLEASSLIEQYLEERGRHRFMGADTEELGPFLSALSFFWKFFSSHTLVSVRVGRPLDVFGNFVDEEGRSIGPNGTAIDPRRWLMTRGELKPVEQRDQQYTRMLGDRLVASYYRENTVLSSHLVAFSFFGTLRKKYSDLDLFRFLRLSPAQRSLPLDHFLQEAEVFHRRVRELADAGRVHLADELKTSDVRAWVEDGVRNLGVFHETPVVRVKDGVVWTADMNLLYYYRNRLTGYGLSLYGDRGPRPAKPGEYDQKGFLA